MELRQLLYFTTLSETLNFRRAAERLNISQPPLSVAIRKLEEELGAALFVRSSRGVTLTAAGEVALEHARSALAEASQLRQAVLEGSSGERGRLALGFVGSAIYALLPRLLGLYRKRYPKVNLVLQESTSIDIVHRILARQLDVGLVRLPLLEPGGLESQVIERDEFVVAMAATNPLASHDSLALSALAGEPFILYTRVSVLRGVILAACHRAGFVPQIAQEAAQVFTILSLVQSGLGVALVPSKATRQSPEGVKLLRLEKPQPIEAGVVIARGGASPLARNFLDLAKAHIDIR
ncbi:MAG: LysR family transcriptional regulator [Sphingomonas sp.]|nr:LysR family transcriptional regulator [Sphingomonas sp.]